MFTTACSPKQHAWNPWRHKCCMRGLLTNNITSTGPLCSSRPLTPSAFFLCISGLVYLCLPCTDSSVLSVCMTVSTEAQQRPYYADYSPARLYIHTLCTNHYLDLFITCIIGINVVTMSIEHFNQPHVSLWILWILICLTQISKNILKNKTS